MKNTVSPPTAKRLKAAGFPQPEPEAGQVWYEGQKAYVIGAFDDGEFNRVYFNGSCFNSENQEVMVNDIFAPTATDILPSECFICREISYKTKTGERWVVYDRDTFELLCKGFPETDNPAEAAAAAWLEIHEKKAFTPNVRITFEQNQTIECYDFEGNQRLLEIQKDKQYDAVLNDGWATIESVFGPVKFRLKEVVLFEWLSNKLNEQI
jgi:hypothetical protein